jgi:curved DNA-binding protein CbpA
MRRSRPENYYHVLDVPAAADDETIRQKYKALARRWHPDRNPGDRLAEEQIKQINEAYAVLRDPLRRRLHDLLLAQGGDVRAAARAGERMSRAPAGGYRSGPLAANGKAHWHRPPPRLMRWEIVLIGSLLRSSIWFFTNFHMQLLSPWFWLVLLAGGTAIFLFTWPASLAIFFLLILLIGLIQALLLFYVYVRIKLTQRT